MEQQTARKFVVLSEYSDGVSADAICTGSWKECIQACFKDEAPCYVVEMLRDKDGDEEQSNDILFVNKAWNRRHCK